MSPVFAPFCFLATFTILLNCYNVKKNTNDMVTLLTLLELYMLFLHAIEKVRNNYYDVYQPY